MGKFLEDFKAFALKGNVVDMAVGVIVGGAFTAIITALTGQILQPLINWLLAGTGAGLEAAVTILKPAYVEGTDVIDLANSIYINWGAFITAVINFILVALILFCIVKAINSVRAGGKKLADKQKKAIEKKLKKRDFRRRSGKGFGGSRRGRRARACRARYRRTCETHYGRTACGNPRPVKGAKIQRLKLRRPLYGGRFSVCQVFKKVKSKILHNILQKTSFKHFYFVNMLCYNLDENIKYSVSVLL